jgi:putative ABC transport system permease protein
MEPRVIDHLIDIIEETVRTMIAEQYKQNAADAIQKIHNTPSESELQTLRDMIFAEMYKDIASIPTQQQTMMKHQINLGFVAQNWASKTGMSAEKAMSILARMSATEFDKTFTIVLNETATNMYEQYSGMSSSADNAAKVAKAFDEYLRNASNEDFIYFYENHMPDKVSAESHGDILERLGVKTIEDPDFIYIYPVDFEKKESISEMINQYNSTVTEDDQIEYTDMAAMLMSSVSNIITAISVVLICFVSISLVVSSIMIGIITYISVLERTKEIGILRAVGASKRDISRVFNAETMIVGLLAGLVGIMSTVLLCFPISWVARTITGITSLTAELPWYGYFLVLLSITLTLIAGLFPSQMAAKKDPVIALRTE